MINKISIINKFDKGLFRDDGLGIFHNDFTTEIERKKKAIVNFF